MNKYIEAISIVFLLFFGVFNAQSIIAPSTIYANQTFPITIVQNTTTTEFFDVSIGSYQMPLMFFPSNSTSTTIFALLNSPGNYTITANFLNSNMSIIDSASANITVLPDIIPSIISNITNIQANQSAENQSISTLQGNVSTIQSNITALNSTISVENSQISSLSQEINSINATTSNTLTSFSNTISSIQGSISTLNSNITTINSTFYSNLSQLNSIFATFENNTATDFSAVATDITNLNSTITTVNNSQETNSIIIGIIAVAGLALGVYGLVKGKGKPKPLQEQGIEQEIEEELEKEEKQKVKDKLEQKEKQEKFELLKKKKQEAKIEALKEAFAKDKKLQELRKAFFEAKNPKIPNDSLPEFIAYKKYVKGTYGIDIDSNEEILGGLDD